MVPEDEERELEVLARRLAGKFRLPHGELKGRTLSEDPISYLITGIQRTQSIFVVSAMDLGLETLPGIEAHRDEQASLVRKSAHGLKPGPRDHVLRLAERLSALPAQLYAQLVLLADLAQSVIQVATLEYAQRKPEALRAFRWTIDAKDESRTEYEDLWLENVKPMLQTAYLNDPLITLNEGDYSEFSRFENLPRDEPPEYLRHHVKYESESFRSIDLNTVLEDLAFEASHTRVGLQLVDVLANTFRRACNGRLRRKGWRNLGHLMIRNLRWNCAVPLRQLRPVASRARPAPYSDAIAEMEDKSRPFVTPG